MTKKYIIFLILVVLNAGFAFGQQSDSIQLMNSRPIERAFTEKKEVIKQRPKINHDSIDNSELCKRKNEEYLRFYAKLLAEEDSLNNQIKKLKESHSGSEYRLEIASFISFDWQGCFQKDDDIPEIADYIVWKIAKIDKSHSNPDGSPGQTFYYDDIQSLPK